MDIWDVVLLVLLVLLIIVGAVAIGQLGERPIKYADSAIVNLKSGHAVEGVIVSQRRRSITLAEAMVMIEGRDPEPVDGKIVVQRGNVDFVQLVTKVAE
jgi:hypothetical protein